MTFHADALAPSQVIAEAPAKSTKPGFFERLLAAMMASRQEQADREIAHYIALRGGRLSDANELEIELRFLGR